MTHVHVVIRRVNPAFKIDLVQVGYIKDGQFETLYLSDLAHTPISDYVEHSSIAASPYIDHGRIPSLVEALVAYPDFSVDFFDNTLVLMFSTDLTHDESTSKEEGKGD
jgi:hypothetical protein